MIEIQVLCDRAFQWENWQHDGLLVFKQTENPYPQQSKSEVKLLNWFVTTFYLNMCNWMLVTFFPFIGQYTHAQ